MSYNTSSQATGEAFLPGNPAKIAIGMVVLAALAAFMAVDIAVGAVDVPELIVAFAFAIVGLVDAVLAWDEAFGK